MWLTRESTPLSSCSSFSVPRLIRYTPWKNTDVISASWAFSLKEAMMSGWRGFVSPALGSGGEDLNTFRPDVAGHSLWRCLGRLRWIRALQFAWARALRSMRLTGRRGSAISGKPPGLRRPGAPCMLRYILFAITGNCDPMIRPGLRGDGCLPRGALSHILPPVLG